ncbi:MAG TPA: ABC transporter substrate-binding protein [Natronosporangium sp.]
MSGIDRRRTLKLFGAFGAAGLAAACGDDPQIAPPAEQLYESHVRIGLLVPATGGYKAIGDDILNGFRRFLATTGNRLGGHPVVEDEEDEGETPEAAQAAFQRMVERRVHAVVGVVNSASLLQMSGTVEDALVPVLSANASPVDLQGNPYIWRTSYVNHEPGLAGGGYLASAVNGQVAVIAQDDLLGTEVVAGLQEAFATAGESDRLLEPILTPYNDQPEGGFFDAALAQLPQDVSAVFAVYAGAAAAEFLRAYLGAGRSPEQLYGPAFLTEGINLTEFGGDVVGIRTAGTYATELPGATNRAFAVAYRAEYGQPTMYSVAGYDAAVALDTAIRLAGDDLERRQINLMLGEIGLIDSPRGRWQFNQSRTPTQAWYLREVNWDGPVLTNLVLQELGTLG